MEFLVVGLNHRSAPLEVREQMVVPKAQMPDALKVMGNHLSEGVLLCTCNRFEVYTLGEEHQLRSGLETFLAGYFDVSLADVEGYLYTHRQQDCMHHLFRVVSSLDSMIVGESEVLRQVRDAFGAAVAAKTIQGPLSRFFHQAIRVGKRVRRDTNIGRNALSMSRACVELARRLLGDLTELKIMVIGIGDAGKLATKALVDSGVKEIIVANRTHSRAVEMADQLGGQAIPFEEIPRVLKETSIVIGSTGSPGYILGADEVRGAMDSRPEKPLFLMDIAIPRDFDPASAEIPNVHSYDQDDLAAISEANRLEREREARKAEEIVLEEVGRFSEWCDTMDVVPTIADLRQMAEEIRQNELAKTLKRLDHRLTSEDFEFIDSMTTAIVNKLLHHPTAFLKAQRSPNHLQLARELFSLDSRSDLASQDDEA